MAEQEVRKVGVAAAHVVHVDILASPRRWWIAWYEERGGKELVRIELAGPLILLSLAGIASVHVLGRISKMRMKKMQDA